MAVSLNENKMIGLLLYLICDLNLKKKKKKKYMPKIYALI